MAIHTVFDQVESSFLPPCRRGQYGGTGDAAADDDPGVGPITAQAIEALAPPMESFGRRCELSAWLGLVPRQHTTGGKPRLDGISKMGQHVLSRADLL